MVMMGVRGGVSWEKKKTENEKKKEKLNFFFSLFAPFVTVFFVTQQRLICRQEDEEPRTSQRYDMARLSIEMVPVYLAFPAVIFVLFLSLLD
jgi:hypothetical protein